VIVSLTAAIGAAMLPAAVARAQQDGARPVQMRTLSVYDILYVLTGAGGNSGALLADNGSVLVDTKLPGSGQAVRDVIGGVTEEPVRMIINTHAHPDHVGSNSEFPAAAQIVAHENTKARMAKSSAFGGANAKFLPNKTFTDRLTLDASGDSIDLYYFGRGHTDGDAIVVFRKQKVAFMGDLFPGKTAPIIDASSGGSGIALAETLAKAVSEIRDVDRIVVGHLPTGSAGQGLTFRALRWSDLQEYAQFTRDFVTAAQEAKKAGKSVDQAAAALNLPEKYKAYDMQGAKAAVQAIYDELGR
jgi:glyoxylase-like metal-dependent hydrolase (beta-lactamase superfamily II)